MVSLFYLSTSETGNTHRKVGTCNNHAICALIKATVGNDSNSQEVKAHPVLPQNVPPTQATWKSNSGNAKLKLTLEDLRLLSKLPWSPWAWHLFLPPGVPLEYREYMKGQVLEFQIKKQCQNLELGPFGCQEPINRSQEKG